MNTKLKKSIFASPNGKSYLLPFILVTSLFLMWGLAHGLLDVLNKHFQEAFTMSKAQSGLVQFSTYIAYGLFGIPAGLFMKRYGYKKGILLGLFLYAVGAFSFIPAAFMHSANPFLVALFVVACGLCVLETAANPYSSVLGPKENAAQRLNLSQSFNGLGWILGPYIGGQLILGAAPDDTSALTKPYIIIGTCVLIIAVFFFLIKLPEVTAKEEQASSTLSLEKKSMWQYKHFKLAIIAQFLYCAAQTGIFSFFINYVTEHNTQISPVQASHYLAFGGMLLFMIGRLSGSIIMSKFKPNKLLAFYSIICCVAMILVILPLGDISLYALYISFFFMSIMFPTIFALGLAGMGSYTQKASSYIILGVSGGAFAPMLMGYLGEENMAIGFLVPLFCFIYILFYSLKGYQVR
ncbi:MAG: L-fucose:H+ symporter permease [Massilibacteroides sp.]|nr:L-fucose:H+ symporter permease [Massilibacteroides sp.]MDD3063443.1 L-fucose:H+ symporter permease [Massilibacteroides sp.]MDD4114467.1 L-fucose:H+ symporter permease [Massilibacteroides sp.]MDD4660958.1 L-fucose:H+ symporter permease [Massilibacteroides sp.]